MPYEIKIIILEYCIIFNFVIWIKYGYAVVNAQFPLTISTINKTISLWNKTGSNLFPAYLDLNVGIGITTPSAKLDVSGTIKAINLSITDNTNTTIGNFSIIQHNSSCVGFRFNNSLTAGGMFACER